MVTSISRSRKDIEKLYNATLSVTEYTKQKDITTKRMVISEQQPEEKQNIPCRLSFNAFPTSGEGEVSRLQFSGKIFCKPDITILPGSKLTVVQNSVTYVLKNSGIPAVHETHQEIMCENWEDNA